MIKGLSIVKNTSFALACVASLVILAGSIRWLSTPDTLDMSVPLTSVEVSQIIGGTAFSGSFGDGPEFEATITKDFDFIYGPDNYTEKHELMQNGLLCADLATKRYCFRVHSDGRAVEFRFSNGAVRTSGIINKK